MFAGKKSAQSREILISESAWEEMTCLFAPSLSGVQRVSLQEFERLGSDYDVFLICKEPGPLSFEAEKLGVHVFYVNSLCREISIINDLKSLLAIYRIIKSNGFDIVHSHSSKTGLLGRLAAKLARVPLIIHTVHGFPFDGAKNSIFRFIYKVMEIIGGFCSDKIICLHQLDKDIFDYHRTSASFNNRAGIAGVSMQSFNNCVTMPSKSYLRLNL